jgi:serine/threonine protein phosphatase PrpC
MAPELERDTLWRVVAASVPGSSHARAGQVCQDAHAWRVREDGAVFAAVADGAGSALFGGEGARAAVEAAVSLLASTHALADDAAAVGHLRNALGASRQAVLDLAAGAVRPERDFATTLIVIALWKDRIGVAQVGDGAVVIADERNRMRALTRPAADEFVNETTFITAEEGVESAQIVLWSEQASRVAAFTDGLQQLALKMPAEEPHEPFFAPLFQFAARASMPDEASAELSAFLRSPRIVERSDDDITLLLAARTAR